MTAAGIRGQGPIHPKPAQPIFEGLRFEVVALDHVNRVPHFERDLGNVLRDGGAVAAVSVP